MSQPGKIRNGSHRLQLRFLETDRDAGARLAEAEQLRLQVSVTLLCHFLHVFNGFPLRIRPRASAPRRGDERGNDGAAKSSSR